jgi:hypothetical protein
MRYLKQLFLAVLHQGRSGSRIEKAAIAPAFVAAKEELDGEHEPFEKLPQPGRCLW